MSSSEVVASKDTTPISNVGSHVMFEMFERRKKFLGGKPNYRLVFDGSPAAAAAAAITACRAIFSQCYNSISAEEVSDDASS
jgi:hypothetical protein